MCMFYLLKRHRSGSGTPTGHGWDFELFSVNLSLLWLVLLPVFRGAQVVSFQVPSFSIQQLATIYEQKPNKSISLNSKKKKSK